MFLGDGPLLDVQYPPSILFPLTTQLAEVLVRKVLVVLDNFGQTGRHTNFK